MSLHIGIDPSSTRCGLAVTDERGAIYDVADWDVRGLAGVDKWREDLIPRALFEYNVRLRKFLDTWKPESVTVEHLSVTQNMDTVRKIAYFEGVSLMAAEAMDCWVRQVRTTGARKAVLGNGGLSKTAALPLLEKMARRSLTLNEADALLFAFYGAGVKLQGLP